VPSPDAGSAPLSRRARRLATGQTPVVPTPAPEVARSVAETVYPAESEPVPTAAIALPATASFAVPTASAPAEDPATAAQPVPQAPVPQEPAQDEHQEAVAEPVDEFAAAARLFSFTGETPLQRDGEELVAERIVEDAASEPVAPAAKHKASRGGRAKRASLKRVAAASVSLSAIAAVGLLAVGTTMPAEAVAGADTQLTGATMSHQSEQGTVSNDDEIQAYVAPGDSEPVADELHRAANYSTATLVEMAGTTGISNVSSAIYTNNPLCDVQWPFAVGVPISFGYGPRPGEFHKGVDFTPGSGAHVQAIADGTVRVAQEGYQGYGVAVIIDHVVDGQHVASLYGHMEYGSLQVHAGEHVKVGQYLGRTGNTGYSFGAHTHVEIRQNGVTPIDPLPWLRAHNKC
jgi:murein DD-endopeptidase MepM/ murein hydrolase activator NlpD